VQSNDVTLLRFFKFIENVDIEDCNRNFSNSGGTAKISGGGAQASGGGAELHLAPPWLRH
jgi:hypothetical protein